MYPLHLVDATAESVETVFTRFLELQSAWAERFTELLADAQEPEDEDADEEDPSDGNDDPNLIIKA